MVNNVNAQKWLDEKYPKEGVCKRDGDNKNKKREEITALDIRKGKIGNIFFSDGKKLVGSLKLEKFTNLRTLIVSSHQIIDLDVSDCPNLEELDCHDNELISLNVIGCSNLKVVDCSNNNIRELDLSTCTNLNEVSISNCSKLTTDTVKSDLVFNTKKTKLVRGPVITNVKENDIRNILIIGITGNGKSALANVLSGTNGFKESNAGASKTKVFQESEFEWEKEGKKVKYRVIDNIGFGDTNNVSKSDILFKIGEGIHSAKEGINQVLFVFKGRLSPEHITAFNLFKDFISESRITEFTTIIRTGFESFRNQQKREEDQKSLLEQNNELVEVVKSCKGGMIYVDNPPIDIDDERNKERNKKSREKTRKIVLDHLVADCQEIYKLKEWESIFHMVENYNRKKEKVEESGSLNEKKALDKEKGRIAKEINEGIKVSVGAEIPGLPVGLTAAFEYNTQKKY